MVFINLFVQKIRGFPLKTDYYSNQLSTCLRLPGASKTATSVGSVWNIFTFLLSVCACAALLWILSLSFQKLRGLPYWVTFLIGPHLSAAIYSPKVRLANLILTLLQNKTAWLIKFHAIGIAHDAPCSYFTMRKLWRVAVMGNFRSTPILVTVW